MKTDEAKQIPITDLLAKLNHKPTKELRGDAWYYSPFHEENTPSFKVDTRKNLWYDFSISKGGSIIDLVMELYNYTVSEALKELASLTGQDYKPRAYERHQAPQRTTANIQQNPKDQIRKLQELQNPALIDYLQSRKISIDIAKHYLKEIYYTANGKNFFALAFENDSGAYELRNKHFKGGLKGMPKDITTISSCSNNKNPKTLLILEGFIDFLSFFTVKAYRSPEELKEDVIVLNSLVYTDKLIQQILPQSHYKELHLYLDTDSAGRRAVNKLLLEVDSLQIIDQSNLYAKMKGDLNDALLSSD